MQPLRNTRFIFCGSNHCIMSEIFNNAKRPFYGSCMNISLGFIAEGDYSNFIANHFKKNRKTISKEAIEFILDFTQSHTYYTQLLCNQVYASNIKKVTLENVRTISAELLKQQENNFYQYRNLLTGAQWLLLTAIAEEVRVTKPHAAQFIKKYKLGTSSMVTRSLESLLQKEMIYYTSDIEEPYYAVYDKFLMRWLQ